MTFLHHNCFSSRNFDYFFSVEKNERHFEFNSLMGPLLSGNATDNAVVVVDNIYRHVQEVVKDVKKASFIGTKEVFRFCLHSHEVIVFLPIKVFTEGIMKEMFL